MGSLSSLQKSEFLKLINSFLHFFGANIKNSGTTTMEKTPIYIFSTFGSKKKQVWEEKIRKKRKNFKNLKVEGNYPNTYPLIQTSF